jgi:uncharacterized protein YhbP (UPF0306 family)
LRDRVERFLAERASMALATQGPDGLWVASVYFAGGLGALYFLSSPDSRHGRNLSANSRIAAAINEDEHDWRLIRGVQLDGMCALADSAAVWLRGWRAYLARFPDRAGPVSRAAGRWHRQQGPAHASIRSASLALYYLDNRLGFGKRQEVFT